MRLTSCGEELLLGSRMDAVKRRVESRVPAGDHI